MMISNMLQVVEVLPTEGMLHINFMTQQGDLYYWNSKPDQSWEDIQTFCDNSRKVTVYLNEAHSSQRKQMYSVI